MASPPDHYLGIATESVHPTATQSSSSAEGNYMISAGRGDGHGRKRWTRLVDWLRDVHGMDVGEDGLLVECRTSKDAGMGLYAVASCPPSTTLFTIPAKALINMRTLAPLYPATVCKLLTPTQLISLHLSIHAPTPDGESSDPTFGPYISTLPRNFDAHPVSWLRGQDAAAYKAALLAVLPPTICSSLKKAHTRLTEDWSAVSGCFTGNHAPVIARRHGLQVADFSPTDSSAMKKFTWAWLSVNTRCIYYQSQPVLSAPENMTMCPVLDFANHAPSRTHVFPVLPSSIFPLAPGGSKKRGQTLGGDYMFLSSSQYPIEKDEELFLRYGAHANRTLFVEYGFVNMWQQGDCLSGKFSGEVDIQGALEELFTQRGGVGAWMKGVLEGEGYWGDWTMHSSPTPAHPSYRVMNALRLYHLFPLEDTEVAAESDCDTMLRPWRRTLVGQQDAVSEANEIAWRETLLQLCGRVIERAKIGQARLDASPGSLAVAETPEWLEWMIGNIRLLWLEEEEVAEAVAASLRAGEEF